MVVAQELPALGDVALLQLLQLRHGAGLGSHFLPGRLAAPF